MTSRTVLVLHGGAGRVSRDRVSRDEEREMREGLRLALQAGRRVLDTGGRALDAVQAAVEQLESHEAFNAGRGSALTSAGGVQMDASIMEGATRAVGAVACVTCVVHPVAAARAVLERTPHVLLAGADADRFAAELGLATAAPEFFVTPRRREQLEQARALAHEACAGGDTVGAVALDARGHLAAATSTGGMANKLPGRVGDSPIAGAGVWADDRSCAVSATGAGEMILRSALAHEIDARVRLLGATLVDACHAALERVLAIGGQAGCVAVDAAGRIAAPFTTEGMPRGVARGGRPDALALFRDETLAGDP